MEPTSLRTNVFNTIMSCHCDQLGCEFKGKVKYDTFLHNVRIHRRCILCRFNCESKKGIMDHVAFFHQHLTKLMPESKSKEQQVHEGDKVFICYLCDANFEDKVSVRRHLDNGCKIFYCAKCNGKFKSKRNLQEHIVFAHYSQINKGNYNLRLFMYIQIEVEE